MMRRYARQHETIAAQRLAGTDQSLYSFAQAGDHVMTVDGPGVVADVYPGPVAGGESYFITLDNGLGEGEYSGEQVLEILTDEFTVEARRYSQVPMACDVCGAPASKSRSGGRQGHTMLCPDCITERDRQKAPIEVSSAHEPVREDRRGGRDPHARGDRRHRIGGLDGVVPDRGADPGVRRRLTAARLTVTITKSAHTGARSPLPLMTPEELRSQGLRTAADDYDQLGEILWERPDLIEAEPVQGMPRRMMLGSKTYPTDTGGQIDRVHAAEIMYGTGSPQHLEAIERFSPKTAAVNEPVWLKERRSNPIKDSLNDEKQPWWWRKVVGPSLDRYNDAVPPNRQIRDYDDIHKIDSDSWCRFRRKGECYFPKDFDERGSEEAGYAVWIPYNRGECPWKTWDAQKHQCKVSEPGPKSGEVVMYPDATVAWSQGGQRTSSITETPVSITRKAESSWVDVREKAKRIRQSGGVRIISSLDNSVTGEVRGDTGLYTATVTTVPGSNQVALATCSCPWETYRWARSGPWKKLEGRACAHITALLFEMQARKMFGGEITEDVADPEWRTEQPALENPKSKPRPWRLDVAASVQGHLSAVTAQRDALEARAAVQLYLDPQVLSLGLAVANLRDDEVGEAALVSVARLTEGRSLLDVPPFYAQVSGEIVVVDGFDEEGTPWANGRPLSRRQIMYPTFHPTRGITGSLYADDVDEGSISEYRYNGPTSRTKGDEGYYSRQRSLLDNGMPKGQIFSSAEAMERYVNTVARAEGLPRLSVSWEGSPSWEASAQQFGDDGKWVLFFGSAMRNEFVALHEIAHVLQRSGKSRSSASHGGDFAAEHARLMKEYMGVTLQTGFSPMDFAAAKKTAAHSGVMVALVPSAEVAASISLAAAEVNGVRPEPAEEVHLTLAYLGKAADIDKAKFHAAVQGIAAAADRLVGKASGWGTFDNGDEKVLWSSVDVPGLDVLRMMVLEGLTAAGLPVATDHGFTPHMTAGYADEPITVLPSESGAGTPLVFDSIVAAHAGEWTYFDLTDPAGEAIIGETKTAMFEPRPDGEVLAREGEIVYRRKSMLGDNGVEAWLGDSKLVGTLIWSKSTLPLGMIESIDVLERYQRQGIATKMFELAKQVEPRVHHSHALTDDGKAWSKAVGASAQTEYTHAGLVIKAADSGRVLMTQRTPYHADDEKTSGAWEFPGGSIEDGESPWDAAVREFGEETGLTLPEGYRIEGELPNGDYVAFLVTVPHESWTVNAELLPLETMGIGWFNPDHVEDSPLTRPEVDDTDWEMVKDASLDVEAEAEAILHEEPQPALPEALGSFDEMEPVLFGSEMHTPNSLTPRSRPEDMFEEESIPEVDPAGIQNFGGVDPRVAWLMDEPAQGGDDDIAMAAQAVLAKMALKTFSIEEQHELIHEGAEDNRGARNTDRLSIEGTHYEYEVADGGEELDTELLW